MDSLTQKKTEDSRIDIRVSKEDKELFELAGDIYGAKTLSEFIRYVLQKESKAIISERKRILASERDREIFFTALMGDKPKVNEALVTAFKRNKEDLLSDK